MMTTAERIFTAYYRANRLEPPPFASLDRQRRANLERVAREYEVRSDVPPAERLYLAWHCLLYVISPFKRRDESTQAFWGTVAREFEALAPQQEQAA